MATLFPSAGDVAHWWFRFLVMMALSVVIAVMGLSMNSDAVVIGAMLIAPLMTPVLGVSAAIVMGWPSRIRQSVAAIIVGSLASVAIAWLLTWILPSTDQALTSQVLSRTSPDLRNLIVALAAGAAGAYATTRDDVAAALPGVAVAVALVPPLAVIGFTLAVGRLDLTRGAVLLFTVNLVAIVLAGAVVFLASGFVPISRLRSVSGRVRAGLAVAVVLTVGLAVPLTTASLRSASQSRISQIVNQSVVTWLDAYPSLKITSVVIDGREVAVQVSGAVAPPSTKSLLELLRSDLGRGAGVHVQWFQTS